MNDVSQAINAIYESGIVVGQSGKVHKVHSAIDQREGDFLSSLIRGDSSIRRTLEVGCAFGLSSLHICAATLDRPGASHTIIDPFQNSDWDGAGVAGLEALGIHFFQLMEVRSEFALPKLLENNESQFDFVFVDGWHTFDHTLIDCFYATRLLRIGGMLAIDDVSFPSVRRVVDFLKHFPCYEEAGVVETKVPLSWKRRVARMLAFPLARDKWENVLSPRLCRKVFEGCRPQMIALRKVKEDSRNWDWHVDAF